MHNMIQGHIAQTQIARQRSQQNLIKANISEEKENRVMPRSLVKRRLIL